MPLPATHHAPEFLRLEHVELRVLMNVLRCPLATQIFMLVLAESDFKTGELVTNYARLIELCTPPAPERGRRVPGPTLKQVRNAVADLIAYNLVKRNAAKNEAQQMLRLYVRKRSKPQAKKHA